MAKATYKFKKPPDGYQLTALKRALKYGQYGIFFEQRVGKTRVAIDFCGCKRLQSGIKNVLIVCPLSVIYTWEEQIHEYYPYGYSVYFYPKTPTQRTKLLEKLQNEKDHSVNFIVANYDRVSTYRDKRYVEIERIQKHIKIDVMILDESHLVKNYKSRRHGALYKLAKSVPYRLLLTGTPIAKKFPDIFGQYRILDDRIYGAKWSTFRDEFCIMGGFKAKEIVGCQDQKRLSELMASRAIRVLRKDVMDEPEVEDINIPVVLEPEAQRIYDELKTKFIAELQAEEYVKADFAITRLLRLQQLCGGFIKDEHEVYHDVSKAKIEATVDLLDTLKEGGKQAVVFHRFTNEANALLDALNKKKYKIGCINGGVSSIARQSSINAFQGGKLDVILIQISSGCMGIKLDKAYTNVFYSMDFSLSNYLQAKDRIMGRGQKHDVTNYFIAVRNSVDTKIIKTLQANKDVAEVIADSWAEIFA